MMALSTTPKSGLIEPLLRTRLKEEVLPKPNYKDEHFLCKRACLHVSPGSFAQTSILPLVILSPIFCSATTMQWVDVGLLITDR